MSVSFLPRMVMPTFWQRMVDTFLPPAEASLQIRQETAESFCTTYAPHYVDDIFVLSRYQNRVMQAAVTANKYHHDRHATKLLAQLVAYHLRHTPLPTTPLQIIPIPLSRARRVNRGYNQVELVLQYLIPLLPPATARVISALSRPKDTTPQTKLEKAERLKNVDAAFRSNRLCKTIDLTLPIWLLDDVATTGATLHAAHAALPKEVRRQVQLVALAG